MREVEVKARIQSAAQLINDLESAGCAFSAPIAQDDTVFAKDKGSITTFLNNRLFLRLRVSDGKETIFTVKYQLNRGAADLAPIEHEVTVGSRDEMEAMIGLMGYQEIVRVKKVRRKTRYKEYEICVDEVEGLGSFMEIEKMVSNDSDALAVQQELLEVLASLGVDLSGRVMRGYDILMLEKLGVPAE